MVHHLIAISGIRHLTVNNLLSSLCKIMSMSVCMQWVMVIGQNMDVKQSII